MPVSTFVPRWSLLAVPLVLSLSGCAWLHSPAPVVKLPAPTPQPVLTHLSPTFADARFHFESVWHTALHQGRQNAISCVSLETPDSSAAALACWNDLSYLFRSDARWMSVSLSQGWVMTRHAEEGVALLQAEKSARNFFSHSALWARDCGADFSECKENSAALGPLKLAVQKELAIAQPYPY